MGAFKIYDFNNYSWWEWMIQVFYWIMSICFALRLALEQK